MGGADSTLKCQLLDVDAAVTRERCVSCKVQQVLLECIEFSNTLRRKQQWRTTSRLESEPRFIFERNYAEVLTQLNCAIWKHASKLSKTRSMNQMHTQECNSVQKSTALYKDLWSSKTDVPCFYREAFLRICCSWIPLHLCWLVPKKDRNSLKNWR